VGLEQLSERYAEHNRVERGAGFVFAGPERVELFRRYVGGPGRRVLDLGCRDGALTQAYAGGNEIVGVDADREALAEAEKLGIETRWADLDDALPFEDGSFDVVVSRIAPHHFGDIRAAVAEMARVSNRLVVIEDTLFSSERHEAAERLRDPTHVRNYTEDEWRGFLREAGLEVEQVESFEKTHPLEDWLARTGCEGEEAERVRELLADRMTPDRAAWTDTKIVIRARKSPS
jgi:SAM-dependent methyltransferase